MELRVVAFLILLSAAFSQSAGELLLKPQNTESVIGETTYIYCSTSLEDRATFWYHGNRYVYTTFGILDPYRGRFEIDLNESTGAHNLVIHSVEPGDAGQYICVDDDGLGVRASAELVVLENIPECQSNIQPDGVIGENIFSIKEDEVQLTCNVTYYGNIPPQLEWKMSGEKRFIKDSVTSIITSNRLIYTLKLNSDISLDNSSYVCQTTRSAGYQYKCNSEIIKILYFTGRDKTVLKVFRGDEITCFVDNNTFPCTRQWYYGNYTCPLSCDATIITHLLGDYLCTVKCHIRGTDHSFEALKAVVVEATTAATTPLKAIAASVVVPVVIIDLLIVLIVTCTVRRKRKHRRNRLKQEIANVHEENVELLHKITKEKTLEKMLISGVAILGEKLFLVYKENSVLEVHDCCNFKLSCKLLHVKEIDAAVDMSSCKKNNCLYIMNEKRFIDLANIEYEVLKISSEGMFLGKWATKDNARGFLSTTLEGNVIVTVSEKIRLLEYSSDGTLVHDIELRGCKRPWHSLKLDNDRYIVSHATYATYDHTHRVCVVNSKGIVQKSFGSMYGSTDKQLHIPYYLAVATNGCVFVADLCNDRVLLLDSNLEFKAKIVPENEQILKVPRRIYLGESQLIVVVTPVDREKNKAKKERKVTKNSILQVRGHKEKMKEKSCANTMEMVSVEGGTSMVEIDGDNSKPNDSLLREGKGETMEANDDSIVLILNVKPLLKKYNR